MIDMKKRLENIRDLCAKANLSSSAMSVVDLLMETLELAYKHLEEATDMAQRYGRDLDRIREAFLHILNGTQGKTLTCAECGTKWDDANPQVLRNGDCCQLSACLHLPCDGALVYEDGTIYQSPLLPPRKTQ